MKAGKGLVYGPLSGYDFELLRHLATISDGVTVYDNQDFSQAHKILTNDLGMCHIVR